MKINRSNWGHLQKGGALPHVTLKDRLMTSIVNQLVKLCSYFARLSVSPGSLLELDSSPLPLVPGSFRYLVFVRWFPHFSLSLVRLLINVDPLHTSLINHAFVINNIKPEQVHKCADNDNPANHWRAEKVEAVLFLWHQVASRSLAVFEREIPCVLAFCDCIIIKW